MTNRANQSWPLDAVIRIPMAANTEPLENRVNRCLAWHDSIAILHEAIQRASEPRQIQTFLQLLRIQNYILQNPPSF